MSYTVLARKWRPQNFHQMVGQEHVLRALINALDRDQLHHAYLFTGTRGVGKTSIARVLAKCLNCEKGVSSTPCGECSACTAIAEGRFVDLIEVDAASRTKVEDTRELLENVQYAPTSGRYKVYLIDEVHMLSTHSFNALLKTLEEPPPHVKFLLATTDPQKLPATILSRCLQFHLKNLSPERIVEHLQSVLEQESVAFDDSALWQIGRAADGSMRDALSITDQAIAYTAGEVREIDVAVMLGSIDQRFVYEMLEALVNHDGAAMLQAVGNFAEHAPDYQLALDELISLLHRLAVYQAVPEAIDNSLGDQQQLTELAARISAEDLQLYYQVGLTGKRDFPHVPNPRSALEMTLLRMLAFKPEGILQAPESALGDVAVKPAPVVNSAREEALASLKKPEAATADTSQERDVDQEPESVAVVSKASAPSEPAPVVNSVSDKTPALPVTAIQHENELPEAPELLTASHWASLFKALPLAGVERAVASNCVLTGSSAGKLTLLLDQRHGSLYSEAMARRLSASLTAHFGRPVTAEVSLGEVQWETPGACQVREESERQQKAVDSIRTDKNVQLLVEKFAGELDITSIKPRVTH